MSRASERAATSLGVSPSNSSGVASQPLRPAPSRTITGAPIAAGAASAAKAGSGEDRGLQRKLRVHAGLHLLALGAAPVLKSSTLTVPS